MKVRILLLFSFTVLCCSAKDYTISPSSSLTVNAPYNDISIFDINQVNTANTKILLGWTLISNNLVSGWDFSLCDYGHCIPGLPASGTMDSVPVGGQGFLGLNVNPYNIAGTGSVRIYVYQFGYESQGDTLTWTVSSVPAGIASNSIGNISLSLYPVPVTSVLYLSGTSSDARKIVIRDMQGRELKHKEIFAGERSCIDVSELPEGIYFLTCDEKGLLTTRRFTRVH